MLLEDKTDRAQILRSFRRRKNEDNRTLKFLYRIISSTKADDRKVQGAKQTGDGYDLGRITGSSS